MRNSAWAGLTAAACLALALPAGLAAQSTSANSGTVRGTIQDQSGASIPKATVEIRNPVSGYTQKTQTDTAGAFEFDNVPYNPYHVRVTASGFQTSERGSGSEGVRAAGATGS